MAYSSFQCTYIWRFRLLNFGAYSCLAFGLWKFAAYSYLAVLVTQVCSLNSFGSLGYSSFQLTQVWQFGLLKFAAYLHLAVWATQVCSLLGFGSLAYSSLQLTLFWQFGLLKFAAYSGLAVWLIQVCSLLTFGSLGYLSLQLTRVCSLAYSSLQLTFIWQFRLRKFAASQDLQLRLLKFAAFFHLVVWVAQKISTLWFWSSNIPVYSLLSILKRLSVIEIPMKGHSQSTYISNMLFLTHLSMKCSRWVIVIGHCPSSRMCDVSSIMLRQQFALKAYSSYTHGPIDSKLGRKHRGDL